jgi:MtN3 and saliva related transmembrane protein
MRLEVFLANFLACFDRNEINQRVKPNSGNATPKRNSTRQKRSATMYFLKTGSPEYLRWLRTFEPLMVITGIVTPLATIPSISKLYFTHSQHASGQSLTTWSIFALASLLWLVYGLLNRKAAIYVGNIIALIMNLLMVNGILMHAGWTY